MKLTKYLFGTLLAATSCNSLKEINPPSQTIPEQVIQVVKDKYPESTELLLETLVRDQIWAASFINKNRRYEAVVDHDSFLGSSRLLADGLPDSLNNLLAELAISQDSYEGLREISPDSAALPYVREFATNLSINGTGYTLKGMYRPSKDFKYFIRMTPRWNWEYESGNLTTMPDPIRIFMQQRTSLSEYFHVFVAPDMKKTYIGSSVMFNDAGVPFYSSMGGGTMYGSWAEVPETLRRYVAAQKEMADFAFSSGRSFTDGAADGHLLTLRKEHFPFSEIFELYFDSNGKPIYAAYSAYVKP